MMRINSIKIENYRAFSLMNASFSDEFNIIAGLNGSGKTSLLLAIREILTQFVSAFPPSNRGGQLMGLQSGELAHSKMNAHGKRYRHEKQFPILISATGVIDESTWTCSIGRQDEVGGVSTTGQTGADFFGNAGFFHGALNRIEEFGKGVTYPIFASYPAYRQWQPVRVDQIQAAVQPTSRFEAFNFWWDASIDASALQHWVITKTLERLETSSEEDIPLDEINDDELAIANRALTEVIAEFSALRFDMRQKSLVVEFSNEKTPVTHFANLSDGQRVAISLVVDIARRMCMLNPHLNADVALMTPGIVLIDEIDVHMHPRWQRDLISGLPKAFPRIQFIATSHSPQVLGELRPEQILLLNGDEAHNPTASYGLDSNRVLEVIMGASPRASDVESLLDDIFECIERMDLLRAKEKLGSLKKIAPNIPEISGIEALIKRKEVIGK